MGPGPQTKLFAVHSSINTCTSSCNYQEDPVGNEEGASGGSSVNKKRPYDRSTEQEPERVSVETSLPIQQSELNRWDKVHNLCFAHISLFQY